MTYLFKLSSRLIVERHLLFKMTTCEGQNFIETLWETIFSSSSRETPNRILPNLSHLLILCVLTSVLYGVNKEVKENNNNKKPNPILAFYIYIYTSPGSTDNNLKGKKHTKLRAQWVRPNASEEILSETVATHPQYWSRVVQVSSTNPIPYASDAMVGRCRSTMRRLDNLKR
jgi:hypothetical protein